MIREYCDRCGKDITESKETDPLHEAGFRFIANRRPKRKKWYAHFRVKNKGDYDYTHTICEECLNELWDWWEKGANNK